MERLTCKNWRNLDAWESCGQAEFCKRTCHGKGGCTNGCIVPCLYARLAQYEDLEEQGLLVRLPCKVGDTAYEITGATTRGYDWKYLTYENAYVRGTVFNLDRLNDIGKTVFLTKSEAEAKLKELRGEENGR